MPASLVHTLWQPVGDLGKFHLMDKRSVDTVKFRIVELCRCPSECRKIEGFEKRLDFGDRFDGKRCAEARQ